MSVEYDQIPFPAISDNLKEKLYLEVNNIHDMFGDFIFEKVRGYISCYDVLCAHFIICDYFYEKGEGEPIFSYGVKYPNYLMSSLDRANVSLGNKYKYEGIYEIVSTIFYGLIKNHPFHDANKRTAFLSALYIITQSGNFFINEKAHELEDMTVDIANNNLDKYRRYKKLKNKMERYSKSDIAVKFLSFWFRKRMRKADKRYYAITYRQLDNKLRKYGFSLCDPDGNYIHVCRHERVDTPQGLLNKILKREVEKHKKPKRICKIGFPSWNAIVGKGAIKTVLESTGLKAEYGIDSAAFFKDEEPFYYLLSEYKNHIEKLKYR